MYAVIFLILSIIPQGKNSFNGELSSYLKKNLAGSYNDFKYEVVQMPDSYKKIELLKTQDFNLSGNLVYVPVKIVKKNGRAIQSLLTVRLKLYKHVLVASKKIPSREDLSKNDFVLKKIDVAKLNGTPVDTTINIKSFRSKIFIRKGSVLTRDKIEPIPLINDGDKLNAKYINGHVLITLKVFARQEGVKGEIITVISKDKKLFQAKVIDKNNVLIIE